MSQNHILDFLKKLKMIQKDLKKRNLKTLNSLVIEIIHHIKQIGRVIYYFSLINEDPTMNELRDYNTQPQVFARKEPKPLTYVTEQIEKFYRWKMSRWGLEYEIHSNSKKKHSEIIITCKICLNKVYSNLMDVHSGHCLQRAESLKELNSLIKTTNKHIEAIGEIKQFLITKTKLDM